MFTIPLAEDSHSYRILGLIKVIKAHSPNTPSKSKQIETNQNIPFQGKTIPYILLQ